MDNELKRLKKTAVQIRRDIIEATSHGKGGGIHVGPALSSVDLVTALYFKIMTVNPENPEWMQRDRFILSKGHAYAVWYSALAEKGFFPREELLTMRAINSRLQGHPAFRKTPGVDMTSGSLGNGLACGMGYVAIAGLFFVIISLFLLLLERFRFGQNSPAERQLKITIPENLDYTGLFEDLFAEYTRSAELISVRTTGMGSLYSLHYHVTLVSSEVEKQFLDAIRCRNGNLDIVCGKVPQAKEAL